MRVTATDANGQTASALSAPTGPAILPDLSFLDTGCASAEQAGHVSVDKLVAPARLNVNRSTSSPAVITRSTQRLTLRFHVTACGGKNVQGAAVYATPTPFDQFRGPERATGVNGWATITMTRQRFFPVTPRQRHLIVFVRARKLGTDLRGGIHTRRLVSFRVRLR